VVGSFRQGNETNIFISLCPWFDKNPLKKKRQGEKAFGLYLLASFFKPRHRREARQAKLPLRGICSFCVAPGWFFSPFWFGLFPLVGAIPEENDAPQDQDN
jgi:hypothetical protein